MTAPPAVVVGGNRHLAVGAGGGDPTPRLGAEPRLVAETDDELRRPVPAGGVDRQLQ